MKSYERAAAPAATAGTEVNHFVSRRFPKPTADSVLICPVGGVGQIGMNWTLYGHAGRWILIDAGSAFAPRDVQGVDAIFPDPRSLRSILPYLSALIVTHAHEDHIGAIHRLWPAIKAPIYATPFASGILAARFRELGRLGRVRIRTFNPGDSLRIGPFDVRTVRMTHSVPECVALALGTTAGTILHTGDWKLDPDPVIGLPTDIDALGEIGRHGVLGMVCDSTNADRRGEITSEAMVAESLREVFVSAKGMAVVSCFATNVARLASVARAAAATGRKVAIAGRSMIRAEQVARECGLLAGVPEFIHDVRHLRGLDRREMALICTGSQGEGNAALARLASGDDGRLPEIGEGDVVVHSARVIPGNEEDVETVLDGLRARGATVLQEEFNGKPLHVSGHAKANELETLYGIIRPRFAIPVHGERTHLEAHSEIARLAGVKDVAIPAEGDVLMVSRRRIQRVASVNVDLMCALTSASGVRLASWDPDKQEPVPLKEGNRHPKRPYIGRRPGGKPYSRVPHDRRIDDYSRTMRF